MRPIKLMPSSIAKAKKDILEKLDNLKLQDTRVTFSYDFTDLLKDQMQKEIKKPIVYMTAPTYLKMLEYVLQCDVEIAWHGTVTRGTGNKNHIFYIKDVYLYPQKIAGATVKTDDTEYTKWSDKQSDEAFNNRRFQGHSHVNMATAYSGVDDSNQNEFLQDLAKNDYYIFLVTNKKQAHNFRIYDLAQNLIFENSDIDFRVYLDENTILESIEAEMKNYCKKETYAPTYGSYLPFGAQRSFSKADIDDYNDYYGLPEYPKKTKKTTTSKSKIIKEYGVFLDRPNRDFMKEYPMYEGDVISITNKKTCSEYFVPFEPFTLTEVINFRAAGWVVKEIKIPEAYQEMFGGNNESK